VTRARRTLARLLRLLGTPGIAGIGVLVACASFYASGHRPLEARVTAAQSALAEAVARRSQGRDLSPQAGLEAFYGHFDTGVTAEAWLARIFALAREHGVNLLQGSYRYSLREGERLARYEINLPVSGDYARIRGFIAATLNSVPVASLDRVGFERRQASDSQVEASIRFTLFLEPRTGGSR
jgi:hypothetical protein